MAEDILDAMLAPGLVRNVDVSLAREDLLWTDDKDMEKYLPPFPQKDKEPVAFRDLFAETVVKKLFDQYMQKVRNPLLYGFQTLRDPMRVRKGIHFNKKDDMFT